MLKYLFLSTVCVFVSQKKKKNIVEYSLLISFACMFLSSPTQDEVTRIK